MIIRLYTNNRQKIGTVDVPLKRGESLPDMIIVGFADSATRYFSKRENNQYREVPKWAFVGHHAFTPDPATTGR